MHERVVTHHPGCAAGALAAFRRWGGERRGAPLPRGGGWNARDLARQRRRQAARRQASQVDGVPGRVSPRSPLRHPTRCVQRLGSAVAAIPRPLDDFGAFSGFLDDVEAGGNRGARRPWYRRESRVK